MVTASPDTRKPEAPWSPAVRQLASRVIGKLPGAIQIFTSAEVGRAYAYEAHNGTLEIEATDPIAACVGLHSYLRRECGQGVHWDTELPLDLPSFPNAARTTGSSAVADQYMFNFCTFSYTMAHWGWSEWERQIDWMALHGITRPLALTGHEAVVVDALMASGLTEASAIEFLGSPAFLPFNYMGTLNNVAPSASRRSIEQQAELGRLILDRERSLGMTPVLPAFTGHVPRELAPNQVSPRNWQGFESHVLDPEDDLFVEYGSRLTRAQHARFGSDHLYASDPFIEMIPVDDARNYPAKVAEAILGGLTAADPEAVWVLQSWPFSYQASFWSESRVREFLTAIPRDRLLILDLWAEAYPQWDRFEGFFGRDWIWCGLLNFGGRSDPVADLEAAVRQAHRALESPTPPVGIGLSMEATHNNAVFFELLCDLAWEHVHDARSWVDRFLSERYGGEPTVAAHAAWHGLLDTVYAPSGSRIFPEDFHGLLTARPSKELFASPAELASAVESQVWFEPQRLHDAFEQFIVAVESDPSRASGPLGHDLIEASIAFFSRLIDSLALRILSEAEFGANEAQIQDFLGAFDALDRILSCRPEFRLATWDEAAARSAVDAARPEAVSHAARRLLTTWNESPARELDDYAGRMWHGLVAEYYLPRWDAWVQNLRTADAASLDADLDRLSAKIVTVNADTVPPADIAELPILTRAALTHFGPLFLRLVRQRSSEEHE